jgi:ribosomal protein S12 methylthiotransferase
VCKYMDIALQHISDNMLQKMRRHVTKDELMSIQQGISGELSAEKVGRQMKVIIDRLEGEYYIGRTEFDSPEVDPEVLIERGDRALHIGNFYHVEIVNSDDFDLFGRII